MPGAAVLLFMGFRRLGREDFWLDEAYSFAATQDLPGFLAGDRGAMAIYYTILTAWAKVSHDPAWLRSLSLIASVAGVIAFTKAVGQMYDSTTARVAGLLAGASPMVIQYSVEARAYGVVLLLTAVAWQALYRILQKPDQRRWAVTFTAAAALLPLAHGLSIIQVGAMAAAVAYARPGRRVVQMVAPGIALAGVIIAALLAYGANEIGSWVPPLTIPWVRTFLTDLIHPFPLLALAILVAAAVAVWRQLHMDVGIDPVQRFRQVTFVLWGPGAIMGLAALSMVRPSFISRYALAATLGVLALVALVVVSSRFVAASTVALTAVLLIPQFTLEPPDPSWSRVVDIVSAGYEPGDAIVFATADNRVPFETAWAARDDRPELRLIGPGDALGTFDRFARVADAGELVSGTISSDRVWVIDQPYLHQPSRLGEFMADPLISDRYDIEDRWSIDGATGAIAVMLLSG